MRELFLDLTADEEVAQYRFAGYEGEHNATQLVALLPARMRGKAGAEYRFLFETAAGEAVFSAAVPISSEGAVSVKLPKALMLPPVLKAYVGCYLKQEEQVVLVAKSAEMLLGVQKSVEEKEEMSSEGGSIPGLVVENEVTDSKNPVSAVAVQKALGGKLNGSAVVEAVSDHKIASHEKIPTEKAVALALEDKMARDAVVEAVSDHKSASHEKIPTEKAVALAISPLMKEEDYVVDDELLVTTNNPVKGAAVAQSVAGAVKKAVQANAVCLTDASLLPQRIRVYTKELQETLAVGEWVAESDFAFSSVDVNKITSARVVRMEEDTLYFDDGSFWEGSGQRSSTIDGSVTEFFQVGDYAFFVPREGEDGSVDLHRAALALEPTLAAGKTVLQYGKNLCPVSSAFCGHGETGEFSLEHICQAGEYTFSTDVTISSWEDRETLRLAVTVYYEDGTAKTWESQEINVDSVQDGIVRRQSLTFTVEDKAVREIKISPLAFSDGGAEKEAEAENMMLEYSPHETEYEPYREVQSFVSGANAKVDVICDGNVTTLMGDRNVFISFEYNLDMGNVISRLEKAILDLGGTL